MPNHYRIRIKGHLDPDWSAWFDGLTITHTTGGETVLAGPLADQAALYGLLEKARNLNLTLLSVNETPLHASDDGAPDGADQFPPSSSHAPPCTR